MEYNDAKFVGFFVMCVFVTGQNFYQYACGGMMENPFLDAKNPRVIAESLIRGVSQYDLYILTKGQGTQVEIASLMYCTVY